MDFSLPQDHAGRALQQWAQSRPDFDMAPAFVLARMRRLMSLTEPILDETLAAFGLNHAAFDTLSALRRAGEPYTMNATELAEQCLRTPATLSARIARLVKDGLLLRSPDPRDARATNISLTPRGLALIDEVAPVYLEAQRIALSALAAESQELLAELLQRLLLSMEDSGSAGGYDGGVPRLGLALTSLHESMAARRAVGLPERAGMLVASVDQGGPADRAGIVRGDLVLAVDGERAISGSILTHALKDSSAPSVSILVARENAEDRVVKVALRQT